ncbi:MAG: alpha/beta hydrolase [Gemmatimonadota bacterium]|nr:MAG: alpha/beta hydrolase [Gemmatimonadota bacterium]
MKKRDGYAEVKGAKLYYEITGDGHPLVLIHGGLMDSRMWDDQMDIFAQRYEVIRYDIRGYKDSDPPGKKFSHVEDLYCLLRSLNIEKAYIVGLSLGGMIAIDFALEHPEMAAALIPVASGLNGYQYQDAENLEPRFTAIFKAGKTEGVDKAVDLLMELPYFVPAQENSEVRQRMRLMAKENYNTWSVQQDTRMWPSPPSLERLSEIKIPTLIIVGDHDVSDIFGVADALEAEISEAKKVIIEGAGHHVNMEKPDEFNKTVLDFLFSP